MADAPIVGTITQPVVTQLYLGATAYALAAGTTEERLAAQSIAAWCQDISDGSSPIPPSFEIPDDERAYLAQILEGMHFDHPDLDQARLHMINVLKGSTGDPLGEAPKFTVLPRPFGVATTVAGIEWETDVNTSGEVRWTRADQPTGPWALVTDDSNQKPHQRTLSPLSSATAYVAKVTAKAKNRPSATATVEFMTAGTGGNGGGDPGTGAGLQSAIGTSNVATMNATEAEVVLAAGMRMVQAEGIPFDAEKNGQGVSAWSLPRLVGIARVVERFPDAVFFLTVVNWNGSSQKAQMTNWFDDRLNEIKREIWPILGKRLWLEGVSEPDDRSSKCADWIRRTANAASSWPCTLVGNGPGGRGTPLAGGLVDWHYCDFGDLISNLDKDRIHSTDCTPTLVSNLNEGQVRQVTERAIALKARLILYDTDNAHALNRNVVSWMADEIRKATPQPGGAISSPNLLESSYLPWKPGSLTQVDPGYEPALLKWCRDNPNTQITISDMDQVPAAMRYAGFTGRDNALWYTVSRSYAEWNWQPNPGDPDEHLSNQRDEIHDFWFAYMEIVLNVMKAVPAKRALFLLNDGHDKCGDVLSDYSLRQLSPVASRIERGHVHKG